MSDLALRKLTRAVMAGDLDSRPGMIAEMVRQGDTKWIELRAFLGDEDCRAAMPYRIDHYPDGSRSEGLPMARADHLPNYLWLEEFQDVAKLVGVGEWDVGCPCWQRHGRCNTCLTHSNPERCPLCAGTRVCSKCVKGRLTLEMPWLEWMPVTLAIGAIRAGIGTMSSPTRNTDQLSRLISQLSAWCEEPGSQQQLELEGQWVQEAVLGWDSGIKWARAAYLVWAARRGGPLALMGHLNRLFREADRILSHDGFVREMPGQHEYGAVFEARTYLLSRLPPLTA